MGQLHVIAAVLDNYSTNVAPSYSYVVTLSPKAHLYHVAIYALAKQQGIKLAIYAVINDLLPKCQHCRDALYNYLQSIHS